MPFSLPDWAPPWAGFALLVVAGLFGLAFLFMPFSVFGVKGRLDAIEVRLDEIQGEIRSLVLRLPEAGRADQAEPAGAPAMGGTGAASAHSATHARARGSPATLPEPPGRAGSGYAGRTQVRLELTVRPDQARS